MIDKKEGCVTILIQTTNGELGEWPKPPVSKTGEPLKRLREFKSYTLRQNYMDKPIVIPVHEASRVTAIMYSVDPSDEKTKQIRKRIFAKIKDENAKNLAKKYL